MIVAMTLSLALATTGGVEAPPTPPGVLPTSSSSRSTT